MKHQKFRISILLVLIMGMTGLQAQNAIVAAGGEAIGSGGFASYSVGQVAYITLAGPDYTVVMGVQQPVLIATSIGEEVAGIPLNIMAYPNPTSNYVTLNIENYNNENLRYQLYNIIGEVIDDQVIVQSNTIVPMQNLSSAMYFLKIIKIGGDDTAPVKVFKIIKN